MLISAGEKLQNGILCAGKCRLEGVGFYGLYNLRHDSNSGMRRWYRAVSALCSNGHLYIDVAPASDCQQSASIEDTAYRQTDFSVVAGIANAVPN